MGEQLVMAALSGATETGAPGCGVTDSAWHALSSERTAAHAAFLQRAAAGTVGFPSLPDCDVAQIIGDAENARRRVRRLVVLGIGGSALGPQALCEALAPQAEVYFADNPDPTSFTRLLARFPPAESLYCVISKSGSTPETAAQLLIVLARLRAQQLPLRDHLVMITDPEVGPLRAFAKAHGIPAHAIPPNVGGRFSVLSPVGLFPAAFAGIPLHEVLRGAREVRDEFSRSPEHGAVAWACTHFAHDVLRGRRISVLLPYSDSLQRVGDWWRQLWGESLGKRRSRAGHTRYCGLTPIVSRGATDQHSQLQLYAEGPDDKLFTFLGVTGCSEECEIPALEEPTLQPFQYLAGKTLHQLLSAERDATRESLCALSRPSVRIDLPDVSAAAIGAFFMFAQLATAVAAELYGIDAYDQPGVEASKLRTRALLQGEK